MSKNQRGGNILEVLKEELQGGALAGKRGKRRSGQAQQVRVASQVHEIRLRC